MHVHWMVLYNLKVFCSDMKFKKAATAGLSLNIGPYGKNVSKCFFSETTWTVETKLPRNDHWKVVYKVSVFYADRKSKMAATTGHNINTGPYGENTEIYSSLKLLHWLNLNCIDHWKVLYKLRVFYVDRNSKMTTTAGHSFYIGPIGSFYNQVNGTGSWEPLVLLPIV